mmetsp:Transcript_5553/g.8614  ORF Transcript_5553/g.8614 Transcript_5553/m.8614 type:complete len:223 (+) Transcript_5553:85-753(+)|eukprot:CAMPEP_0184348488 /NCGR_PEP_ID=MMETSP1089-20130417/27686_1 /TAXON_ID=38269 ORGANISM="Gloeochaete wittrockiana, Strain SAG46.84" /NCGR_SAMPLE_ID=MMETSP1089 /ASSEMBLY_ACC=CAM_ASM_000445 /LENGTH=222 /DNA_ID=CAMNT_0026680213 /DNA_START=87 /DNA_END=755 /DNA_ORIENTATION=-
MDRGGDEDEFLLYVKTADGRKLDIHVSGKDRVESLKKTVLELERAENKACRLICQGKMLSEDSQTLRDAGLHDGVYIHCVISEVVHSRQEQEEEPPSISRFREMGFSENEIEFFRSQLMTRRGIQPGGNEADLRRAEEEWLSTRIDIDNNVRDTEPMIPRDSIEGDNSDLLWGITTGFLLGIIMVFWLFERALPRKQKIGIIAGIGCNLSFGLLRMLLSSFN